MEEDDRFKVREFLELQMLAGQRRIRIYFTDIAVYLIEYYTGFAQAYFWPAIPLRILLSPILGPIYKRTIEEMEDTREIMGSTHWYRRYGYEEVKEVWIEPGGYRDKLFFTIERANKGICTPGFGSGTDYLTFNKEKFDQFEKVLKRRLGEKFTGVRKNLDL